MDRPSAPLPWVGHTTYKVTFQPLFPGPQRAHANLCPKKGLFTLGALGLVKLDL
jgi:hypothetical protein